MRNTLLFVLLLAVSVLATEKDLFNNFITTYNKAYKDANEYETRFLIFQENMKKIMTHNLEKHGFEMGMNEFVDMSHEEFIQRMLSKNDFSQTDNIDTVVDDVAPPASVDWRTASPAVVVPVRNQGQCGGSMTYAVVDSIAGEYAVALKQETYAFDIQAITQCEANGCSGQLDNTIWDFIEKYGLWWYYTECPTGPGVGVCISGSNCTTSGNESQLQSAVAGRGPISVLIDASQTSFQLYSSGIYADPKCTTSTLNHAIQVVGYGSTNGQDYWIARNSWGSSWGMKGDILIARNKANVCGIASHACYAQNVKNCLCLE